MPTYDYVCETCGNRFEQWQKMTDEPTTICPTCGGPVHRVIYPVGLVFKGGGFYKTDNRAAPAAESSAGKTAETDKKETGTPASGSASDGKAAASKSNETGSSTSGEAATAGAAATKGE